MSFVVAWNAGSSSLKVVVADWPSMRRIGQIRIERIGLARSTAAYTFGQRHGAEEYARIANHASATRVALDILAAQDIVVSNIRAMVHRIVYGGQYGQPVRLTAKVLRELQRNQARAPLHLPIELSVIRTLARGRKQIIQVTCFDTSYFSKLPEVSRTYPIDRRIAQRLSLRRVGFHGLSHAQAARTAAKILGRQLSAFSGMTIHLGSGCSITAIRNGRPVDTSMGLTPLEGLMMGTRPGDLDPGLLLELLRNGMSTEQVADVLEYRSGLLGVSGYSSDLRDILTAAGIPVSGYYPAQRPTATQRKYSKLALKIFVYRIRKYIGAYSVVLGRVDAIVFTGAAGEGSAALRRLIMSDLTVPGRPRVVAVPTDEEGEMFREARRLLG